MAHAAVPFTVTAMSDDERTECIVCLADFMQQTDASEHIWQCADGHTLCAGCFAKIGGAEALCPMCAVPIGSIRNRALEKLRNAHLARLKARAAQQGGGGAPQGVGGNFTFYPAKVNPLDGGSHGPSPLESASGGEPAAAADAPSATAARAAARFTFAPPSAATAGPARPDVLSGASTDAPASDGDVASTASTRASEASPSSNVSSAQQSASPECAAGAASESASEQQHTPAAPGTRSASASPMDVDASASKPGSTRRSGRVFPGSATKPKWRAKKDAGGKEKEASAGGDGFVFEVSEMLKRTVLEPQLQEHAEGTQTQPEQRDGFNFKTPFKAGPCLFAHHGADSGSGQAPAGAGQPQGAGPQPHSASVEAFAAEPPSFGSPAPKSASARRQHKGDKKGRASGAKVAAATAAFHAMSPPSSSSSSSSFPFGAPAGLGQGAAFGAAPPAESAGFRFAAPNLDASPPKPASAGVSASESPPFVPGSHNVSFFPPAGASEEARQAPFTFDASAASGGFSFNVPSRPAASGEPSFGATSSSTSASPKGQHSHSRPGAARRATRGTPGKKGTSKASPSHRPEQPEEPQGGGFCFRTPHKTQVPAGFKWPDEAEHEAFAKLSRMAGAAAATRLLARNPDTPPSKLLSRVTIADPRGVQEQEEPVHRVNQPAHARQGREAKAEPEPEAEAEASYRKFGVQPQTAGAIQERCMQLKDRGNALFKQHKWEAATNTYAQGAALAMGLLPTGYDATSGEGVGDELRAVAHVGSALYSNGANALEKLGRGYEALECCRNALRLNPGNGKAAVRGAQCAVAQGLFAESVPLYSAAIALGFPNLQRDLAKAEQMREDTRKAAELLQQENGARAKVCLRDALAAAPRAVHVLHLMAKAHLLCQEFEGARTVCKQLVTAVGRLPGSVRSAPDTPRDMAMAVLLARALCGLGKVDGESRVFAYAPAPAPAPAGAHERCNDAKRTLPLCTHALLICVLTCVCVAELKCVAEKQ